MGTGGWDAPEWLAQVLGVRQLSEALQSGSGVLAVVLQSRAGWWGWVAPDASLPHPP